MAVRVTLMAIFCLIMTIYMWRNIKQVEDENFVVLRLLKDWVWVWGLGLAKETTKETWEWWMSCLHVWFVTLGMGMLALQRWHNVPQELFMWNLLLLAISAYGQWCFLHLLIHFMKKNCQPSVFCDLSLPFLFVSLVSTNNKSINSIACMYVSQSPARALRALGLLLADSVPTVGWGKSFWCVGRFFAKIGVTRKRKSKN